MFSGMIGFTTSSTISDDFRVATLGAFSEICFFRARITAESFRGAAPDQMRSSSLWRDALSAAKRASQAARSLAPRRPVARHASRMSDGMSKGALVQP